MQPNHQNKLSLNYARYNTHTHTHTIKDRKGLYGDNYQTLFKAKNVKFSPIVPYTIFIDRKTYLIIK